MFARAQMTASLAFHILFAVAGMAMPFLMAIAGYRHLKTGDPLYREIARRWAKGTAILFAVGAVSGTVLSFELGLLWPEFMAFAGPMVGLPFSLEGYAFFLEAIFLGLFLYGEGRLSPLVHWLCGVVVALSGVASGVLVMAVNAWMHTPTGFTLGPDGALTSVDPWAAFKAASFPTQALHMALAAYASISFAVLGIHAWRLRQDPQNPFHRAAARIALMVAVISTPLQIVSGDLSAKHLAAEQPVKLAAMEAHFETEAAAGLAIGGWPDVESKQLYWAVKIPYALSFLAHGDPTAEVTGLTEFAEEEWPSVPVVHIAFQIMVGCGMAMLAVVGFAGVQMLRRKDVLATPGFLLASVLAAPLGMVALEAGWVVTEVGRQPWIIRGVMRTAEAVTPMPGLGVTFTVFSLLYLVLGVVVVVMLRAHVFQVPKTESARRPEEVPA